MTHYTPVWSGRGSLHDVFLSPRDVLLWQTRGNALVAAAPDLDGMSKKRMTRAEAQATTRADKAAWVKAKRQRLEAKGLCVDCGKRARRVQSVRCAECAARARVRDRARARRAE